MHDAHDAPRGPKTPPPVMRRGSLAEPAPQRSDRSLRRSSGETPLLGVPSLADPSAEASDGRPLRFLLMDEERRKQEEQEEFNSLYAMTVRTPQQDRRLADLYLLRAKRKRKKRRKRRTPRTSSRSLRGRARRRQRQWHVSGSPGDVLLRAVFPSVVVRPEMPCIMAGMDLKDRFSGMIKAGIDGYVAPRAEFPSLVCRLVFSGVSAPRAVLPEAYRNIGLFGRWRGIFPLPLVSGSHLFELLLEEYRVASFPGDDSRNGFRIQHSSWFNSGYMFGISLRGLFGRITLFLDMTANCGLSAVAVHRWSSTSLSWRTGRFPWSCSENRTDSPAVH